MSNLDNLDRNFGVAYFDDGKNPSSGWYSVVEAKGKRTKRFSGVHELSTDTIWWTNISYDVFFNKTEIWRMPILRHDKYLSVSHAEVLKEWGQNPLEAEQEYIAEFCGELFSRIMKISWMLLSDVNPKLRIDAAFSGKTLREDLRSLLPPLEYPQMAAAEVFKSGKAWEEFTPTGLKGPRNARAVKLRRPRISYAMEMMQTPLPKGPFVYKKRSDLPADPIKRSASIKDAEYPCVVEITMKTIKPEIAPIYGFGSAINKDNRVKRDWVAHPEFIHLDSIAEIDVKSLYRGETYWALMPELPQSIKDFLSNNYVDLSWSAGVVAESLWRAISLGEDKNKQSRSDSKAQTSWQGLWIRSMDKSMMFGAAMRLTEMGYTVSSYGLGWIQCLVPEEDIVQYVKEGMSLGFVPVFADVPEDAFDNMKNVTWGGDPKAKAFAHFITKRNTNILWNFDKLPLIPDEKKADFIAFLKKQYGKN